MYHLKIVMIGPCKSGKTSIANIISDSTDNIGGDYRPTQGVRIIEFETQTLTNNRGINAEVELWDCSGDLKFEQSWPALYKDAHGIVFVFDPTMKDVLKKMDYYYKMFVNQNKTTGLSSINNKNCLVIELVKNGSSREAMSLSNQFSGIPKININLEDNGQKLRSEFAAFINGSIMGGVRVHNERDEINILAV